MSKNTSITDLTRRIHIRLNYNRNRITRYSPYEILFKRNIFTNDKITFPENQKTIGACIIENSKINSKIKNKKRVTNFHFKVNDEVYKKSFSPDKMDPIWKGPFKIIEMDKNGNYVIIEELNKITKQNIKNVRPYFREGRM